MSSNDGHNFGFVKEPFGQLESKKIGAASIFVVFGQFLTGSIFIIDGIGPDQITK